MSFNYELTIEDIQAQAEALVEFHSKYTPFFQTKTALIYATKPLFSLAGHNRLLWVIMVDLFRPDYPWIT